ncbi:unnamed protein product [Rhodiola kirilowii]
MHVLSWNARGACNQGTIDYLKTMSATYHISVCGILEPKAGHEKLESFARQLGFNNSMHGGSINNKIWILWKDSV